MNAKRRKREDPVILEMRLSQVRNLVSRLSEVHYAQDGKSHTGWGNCQCELAHVLRALSGAISQHLNIPKDKTETKPL